MLDFYTRPGTMTWGGEHARVLDAVPRDLAGMTRVVQGLLLHEHWAPAYGVRLSDNRRSQSHIRPASLMLDHVRAESGGPLSVAGAVDARLEGVCRHFTVLLVAMLRAQGVPARARCGFGSYFNPGRFEDHWVCEYWDTARGGWTLVDAQIDDVQRAKIKPDFDLLDVPRDRFVIAGDAWARCRAGEDPSTFGIFQMRGLWFIAGNVIRDLAALNNMEMLPWDVWGAMTPPDEPLGDDRLALFDRLSAITHAPDATFGELCRLYEANEDLRVPSTVFNKVLN